MPGTLNELGIAGLSGKRRTWCSSSLQSGTCAWLIANLNATDLFENPVTKQVSGQDLQEHREHIW